MHRPARPCPDCDSTLDVDRDISAAGFSRRNFLKAAGAASALAASGVSWPNWAQAADTASASQPESLVKVLFESLSDMQRKTICFAWDYQDPKRGLLRTRVANNWQITEPDIGSEFYTPDQQAIIRQIFEGMIQPDWHSRIYQQLEDDAGGYGREQSIAIFGKPGDGKFEFVMTGRHLTMRCDGNSTEHMAFGGPIFYGHAAGGHFNEDADHPGNVFWPQALEANKLYGMLDGKQQKLALAPKLPVEQQVGFRGNDGQRPGIPLKEMSADQKEQVQKVLQKLIEPYRQNDRDEVLSCLKAQGGLDQCSLAFYSDGDIGQDKVWDCWRLEGPAFVWYFRGTPHVHVWANVSDDPSVATNT